MQDPIPLRRKNLEVDRGAFNLIGKYTAQNIVDWIASPTFNGEVIYYTHHNEKVYMTTPTDAVFFCRFNNSGFDTVFQIEHLGADVSEFD